MNANREFSSPTCIVQTASMDKGGTSRGSNVLGLFIAGLTACTPAATSRLEVTVANDTDDVLLVTVRYPLDSTLLATPEQLASARRQWDQDSSVLRSRGENCRPIERVVRHQKQLYFLYSRVSGVNIFQYDANGTESYAKVSRSRGLLTLTYTLPPHITQILLTNGYLYEDGSSSITELNLQQDTFRRKLLPGIPIIDLFKEERTGREYGNNSVRRIQLTVGPELSVNPSLFHRIWRRLGNGIRVNAK